MNKDKLYSVEDLTKSLIKEYDLVTTDEIDYKSIRQKIYRTLRTTKIWDKAIIKKVGKKKTRLFTEAQKRNLTLDESLYDYLTKNSNSEWIKKRKRYKELEQEIKERRDAHIEYLCSQNMDNTYDNTPFISNKEFYQHKTYLMLEAIFNKFFTPFNDELLEDDLYRLFILKDELDLTHEIIEAEDRFKNPLGSYYFERK